MQTLKIIQILTNKIEGDVMITKIHLHGAWQVKKMKIKIKIGNLICKNQKILK
jgi:hypothetical protein